jgi:hypothetical protein
MKFNEFKDTADKDFPTILSEVLPIIVKELGLTSLPKFKLEKRVEDREQPTFGQYRNDEKTLYLALDNRHPLDILRTLSHEMVHYKQDVNNELNNNSGATGSPEENEAHARAGVIMRHVNKLHPEYMKLSPIELP